MTARVLDGRAVAKQIYEEVTAAVSERVSRGSSRPRLATVLVGEDPASAKYVELKQRNAHSVGIESEDHRLPSNTTTDELLSLVEQMNRDENVSAILIQQPTPKQIDMRQIVFALIPSRMSTVSIRSTRAWLPSGCPEASNLARPPASSNCCCALASRSRARTRWWSVAATWSASRRLCSCSNATRP